ncbi:MAG: 30S ribosomal protein S8e [Thermoplasmata archaeon]|uniref:Small ribosomal subunit protein eS8 n=1 Tax=Candidatus Sysuiplasma superficiale TaxID=2823368 RepID=A0A8J7YNB2_9ARCH|nr:30S ribosomal protein S8e [Candidatus Sysuiplasma superficiale]MBX8643759.1 30S ribosomal protein S8e [Candidatus Sysuiplasma superficiale]MCL5437197.1 30S ribosomal protein S8e [Candidatus Thermoplasmatota archaeon]
MAIWNGRSRRKSTGGRYIQARKKRRYEVGRERQFTFLGEHSIKLYRTKGANSKSRVLSENFANVTDRKTGVTKKVKIVTVKQNPANPNYIQRNIMNKGAVIQTEIGLALITSRPGQHGMINAILLPPEDK